MCLGTVGQVTAVVPARGVEVRAGHRVMTASLLAVTDAVGPGDWVLVHSGLVLARLTEQETRDALELRDPTSEGAP
jgi:hydrogenase maturation factor